MTGVSVMQVYYISR